MPHLWLRIAVTLYGVGLLYSLLALRGRGGALSRLMFPCLGTGLVFHFVSLIENFASSSSPTSTAVHQYESLLAFFLLAFFMGFYLRYKSISPGIVIFPLVFFLTFSAAVGAEPAAFSSPLLRNGWIFLHIALIFSGYAALFFSFVASLLYLLQERNLKLKTAAGPFSRLPSLEVIDEMGYRSLMLGFPFMTFGLLAGFIIAEASFGSSFLSDPKILLSMLMWAVYMILLYTRWSAGWRGRRAAYLSTSAFVTALVAWAANYFSGMHRFLAP